MDRTEITLEDRPQKNGLNRIDREKHHATAPLIFAIAQWS
jgi:hypothetical protein